MATDVDLIVIGTGSAGSTVATSCRSAGWNVAIVDARPFGGTCALRGCDPKRVLVGAAELVDWSRRFGARGLVTGELRIDWPALMRFKRTFTDPVPAQRERSFTDAGIRTLHGRARFVDRTTLSVDGGDVVTARFVAIAAGARPRTLQIPGEEHLATSTAFLELPALPARIVFVGGGYVSFEFAHLAARAGARVEILHAGARPLERFDPELVDRLVEITRSIGIDLRLNTKVLGIERDGETICVHARDEAGGAERVVEADLAVHGAGRVPEIDDLRLDVAGVARTAKGVAVTPHLQSTTNAAVYAAGDAADGGGLPLTPVAGAEGEIVAENLLHGNVRTVDFTGLTSIVYTIPPLAMVGASEPEARRQGRRVRVASGDSTEWFSSRRLAVAGSGFKVLIDEERDLILGASILGPHAEELANLFALAIRARIPASELRGVPFAYPTGASEIEYML